MSKVCCLIGLLVGIEADSEGFDLRANPVRKTPALCPTDEKASLVQSVQMGLGAAQVFCDFIDSHAGGNRLFSHLGVTSWSTVMFGLSVVS